MPTTPYDELHHVALRAMRADERLPTADEVRVEPNGVVMAYAADLGAPHGGGFYWPADATDVRTAREQGHGMNHVVIADDGTLVLDARSLRLEDIDQGRYAPAFLPTYGDPKLEHDHAVEEAAGVPPEQTAALDAAGVVADALADAGRDSPADAVAGLLGGDAKGLGRHDELLRANGLEFLAQQVRAPAQALAQIPMEVIDAVVETWEHEHRRLKAAGAPAQQLEQMDTDLRVLKAVRHMRKALHEIATAAQARASIIAR